MEDILVPHHAGVLSRVLERLYDYDAVRTLKDALRPLKHLVFGKGDIYLVVALIAQARGDPRAIKVVLDIGAAFGDRTITFLRAFPAATVHCFEPQRASWTRLRRRTDRWRERLVLHDYGLFNRNTSLPLRVSSYPDASSILPIQPYMRHEGKREVGAEVIPVRRLDDCIGELSVARIDLMKIDVEGVELEVLEGAERTLTIVDNVFVEISPLRKGPRRADHIEVFRLLHHGGLTFMGQYGDYWFSRDPAVLGMFFGQTP